MNIEVYEGQGCKLYITLNGEFEVYGGTTKSQFTVSKTGDVYLVEIPGQVRTTCYDSRFDIFARRASTGQEWLVESGKITLKTRHSADRADVISCVEYHITKELVESGETVDGGQMIVGIKGDSAYDIARANGYEGTEAEYTEMVTKIPEYADIASTAADNALASKNSAAISKVNAANSAEDAKASEDKAVQSSSDAKAHMNSAAEHATSASNSADAASKSATNAHNSELASERAKQDAEQSAQDAEKAQVGAEQAKTDADAAKVAAQTAERNAKASETQAAADKTAAEQAKTDAQAAQSKAEQEATRAETAQAKAEQEAAEVAEVSWARGFPVFDFDLKADTEKKLRQLAPAWVLPNVALRCTGYAPDGEPDGVFRKAYSKWGAAAWVNLSVHFIDSGRFRACGYTATCAPDLRYIWYIDSVAGVTGITGFAAADYYYKEVREGQDVGSLGGSCKVIEVKNIKSPHRGAYSHFQLRDNISRIFHNTGEDMNYICKSPDGALRHVRVPDGAWEKCKLAIAAFSGAANLPEEYVPDALPQLVAARSMFNGCNLSAAKSISILNSLQQNNGSTGADDWKITMGMHVDHQADADLRVAIDAAVARGWTISEQWNGTATATTFALRPAPPLPVYAKVDTYTDDEGNEQRSLSWCHQVSSPDGKEPEELGYTMFESVEAAREYFGLTDEEMEEM